MKTYFLIYNLGGTIKDGVILQMGNMLEGEENEFHLDLLSLGILCGIKKETSNTKMDEDAWS